MAAALGDRVRDAWRPQRAERGQSRARGGGAAPPAQPLRARGRGLPPGPRSLLGQLLLAIASCRAYASRPGPPDSTSQQAARRAGGRTPAARCLLGVVVPRGARRNGGARFWNLPRGLAQAAGGGRARARRRASPRGAGWSLWPLRGLLRRGAPTDLLSWELGAAQRRSVPRVCSLLGWIRGAGWRRARSPSARPRRAGKQPAAAVVLNRDDRAEEAAEAAPRHGTVLNVGGLGLFSAPLPAAVSAERPRPDPGLPSASAPRALCGLVLRAAPPRSAPLACGPAAPTQEEGARRSSRGRPRRAGGAAP